MSFCSRVFWLSVLPKWESAYFKSTIDPGWAPSLKLGHNNVTEKVIVEVVVRNDRAEHRETKKRKIQEEAEALAARKEVERHKAERLEAERLEAEKVQSEQNSASEISGKNCKKSLAERQICSIARRVDCEKFLSDQPDDATLATQQTWT
ncbi:hypothetical protein AWC38_SpisGene21750 [Stylophora pistillata]|uniref:Uncharacterized protein n=1 Tax=Stylophora pistillata TaxID=50429 RepID=A0A2B4RC79_STYPI|nr:hypothetical protein AWC38_SpisGene21750 [Stylophora pistillata]